MLGEVLTVLLGYFIGGVFLWIFAGLWIRYVDPLLAARRARIRRAEESRAYSSYVYSFDGPGSWVKMQADARLLTKPWWRR